MIVGALVYWLMGVLAGIGGAATLFVAAWGHRGRTCGSAPENQPGSSAMSSAAADSRPTIRCAPRGDDTSPLRGMAVELLASSRGGLGDD